MGIRYNLYFGVYKGYQVEWMNIELRVIIYNFY